MRPPLLLRALLLATVLPAGAFAAVEIKQESDKVTVSVGGQPFTEYHFTGASHVYFYPLIGPGSAKMTRAWPMEDLPGEEHDHPHHRSLWFAHGDVNGIDFWAETASFGAKPPKQPLGQILHQEFLRVQGGEKEGVIESSNKWVAPDGTIPLTSVQLFRVHETGTAERLFDFEVTLTAGEKEVVMGDTKEGTMALRLAESMRVKQPKGKEAEGHMLSADGQKDGDVWGKTSNWVDYWGPVDGKVVGVAIMDHPQNPKHPTRWHARDYGLFAANPFAEHEMDKTLPDKAGNATIPAGKSYTVRYRFLLHEGDATQAKVAERYQEYAASAK